MSDRATGGARPARRIADRLGARHPLSAQMDGPLPRAAATPANRLCIATEDLGESINLVPLPLFRPPTSSERDGGGASRAAAGTLRAAGGGGADDAARPGERLPSRAGAAPAEGAGPLGMDRARSTVRAARTQSRGRGRDRAPSAERGERSPAPVRCRGREARGRRGSPGSPTPPRAAALPLRRSAEKDPPDPPRRRRARGPCVLRALLLREMPPRYRRLTRKMMPSFAPRMP